MGFIDLLSKLFGNKSQRDLKEITPWVERVKAVYPEIDALSDDDLRARTASLRQRISDYVATERAEVEELKASVEGKELDEREAIWAKVDKLEKEILDKLEIVLDEVHPEAFAIVKSTGRRFAENAEIRVKATDFDRDLSVSHDFVRIEDDMAIYQNHWLAGGNEITWDMVHYDVQLFGGTVLHKGKIAEMATGEGKTLVATLPVFLNALTGNGVHVVTVNDYLSKRDSEWMGPLYMFHGLSVDCIDKHRPNTPERRAAYNADITFGTNNEFGFDYLRDNMATSPEDLVQRRHNYAIVDEVDSVLIDDARTPLIISGPVPKGDDQLFEQFLPNVETVVDAQRKLCQQLLIDAKKKISSSDKKEQEEGFFLLFRTYKGMPKSKPLIKYLSEPGIKAGMLKVEEEYMADNMRQMHLVTDELYFVIDEKHNSIELSDKGIDLLTRGTDDPTFFILPDIASLLADLSNQGLSPEELAERKEALLSDYAIKSERVHTVNQLLKAYALFEKDDQYVVMDNKVMIVDEQTGRIMDGRRYSDGLHQAIEAKERVHVEAATQTFATITLQNYFRLYNKLSGMTGTAETEAAELHQIYKLDVVTIPTNRPNQREDLTDLVYKTQEAKFAAVVDDIVERVAKNQPVLVGTTSVERSEYLSQLLQRRGVKHHVLNAKHHEQEAEIVAQAGLPGAVTVATNMAGRGTDIVLGGNPDILADINLRARGLDPVETPEEYEAAWDAEINRMRKRSEKYAERVRKAGGLYVLGTERHESRRIDNQLRGRSGRQGDPGATRFYLSMRDELMVRFVGATMENMMNRLNVPDDVPIEAKIVTNSIKGAQTQVENQNFEVRKNVLKYDEVMNEQRKVIYAERREILEGRDVANQVESMIEETVAAYVAGATADGYVEDWDLDELWNALNGLYGPTMTWESLLEGSEFGEPGELPADELRDALIEDALAQYKELEEQVASIGGDAQMREIERMVILGVVDQKWREHLYEMDYLKEGIGLRAMAQRDPLVEYQKEGGDMFNAMKDGIKEETVRQLFLLRQQMQPTQPAEV